MASNNSHSFSTAKVALQTFNYISKCIPVNHLTSDVLKDVQDVLKYQLSNGTNAEGLQTVSIFGNDMKSEETETLQNDLGEMLMMKNSRTGSSTTVLSKEVTKKSRRQSK